LAEDVDVNHMTTFDMDVMRAQVDITELSIDLQQRMTAV
jgi:hypothetical protein